MSDRKLHETAYSEWKENTTNEYIQAQRRAFMDGFETAAKESEQFNLLREWAEKKRDEAERRYQENGDTFAAAQREAFIEVLVKLSQMNNHPEGDSTNYE